MNMMSQEVATSRCLDDSYLSVPQTSITMASVSSDSNIETGDDLRPEYDLSKLKGGVRGKHFESYRGGTNLALLAPEVRAAFPTDEAVNQALRSLIQGQSTS